MTLSESEIRRRAKEAVRSLRLAVDNVRQRYERLSDKRGLPRPSTKLLSRIQASTERMEVWLTALLLKQASLNIAMQCLVTKVWPNMCRELEEELQQSSRRQKRGEKDAELTLRLRKILQNLFTQLIRLHDGLILCISGECRHKGDIRSARRARYPSKLNQQGVSSDGVTQLYSHELSYSGESWDEFNDPRCGIKQELLRLLESFVPKSQRPQLWDTLIEKGAQPLEAVLDDAYNTITSIQSDCTTFKNRVNLELLLLLQKYGSNIHVDLRLPDKMETFQVKLDGLELKFERLASNFQLKDPAGTIPLLFTQDQWMKLLSPDTDIAPSKHNERKKKRKILVDSSDSEEGDNASKKASKEKPQTKNAVASGLVVKMQKLDSTTQNAEELPASIDAIKQQMGVDMNQLAASRQFLEEEEAAAKREAELVDEAPEDQTDVISSMQQIKRLRKVLARAIFKYRPNDYIWNARECLREACMNAGNLCLEETEIKVRQHHLEQAITCFDEAWRLCLDQQALLKSMAADENDTDFSFIQVSQRYMLLLGRAQLNSGIARVELCRELSGHQVKRYEREAKSYLLVASETSSSLVKQIKQHGTTTDAVIDLMNSYELAVLTKLWLGKLYWLHWRRKRTINSLKSSVGHFHEASEFLSDVDPTDNLFSDDLFRATLSAKVQEYQALITLADLAIAALEEADGDGIRERSGDFEIVFSEAIKSIELAASKSKCLHNAVSISSDVLANEFFLKDHCVMTPHELLELGKKLRTDWKDRQDHLFKQLEITNRRVLDVGRSDVPISDLPPSRPLGGAIILNGSARKQKKRATRAPGQRGYGRRDVDEKPRQESGKPQHRMRYLKWGEELLPQTIGENGCSVPKLVYPAIAPKLPDELKARWEENLRRKAEQPT